MFPRVSYLEVRELGRQRLVRKGSFWVPSQAAGLGDLGVSLSPPGLSVPVGTLRVPGRVRWGEPEEAGPGGSRTAHCGGPGPPEPAGAARGAPPPGRGSRRRQLAAPQLQPQHLPPPDGAGAAGPGVSPPSGCSRGAGGGARAEPEPSRCPSPARYRGRRWAGRPCHCSRRLRVRAGGASSAGKGEAPAPPQSFGEDLSPHIPGLRLRELPPRLLPRRPPRCARSRVTRAAPRVLTPGARGLAAGLLGTCNG